MVNPNSPKSNDRDRNSSWYLKSKTTFLDKTPPQLAWWQRFAISVSVATAIAIAGTWILQIFYTPPREPDSSVSQQPSASPENTASPPKTSPKPTSSPVPQTTPSANPPTDTPQPKTPNNRIALSPSPLPKQPVYNVRTPPNFQSSSELDLLVSDIVHLAKSQGLSTDSLSVYLINLNQNTASGYQSQVLRYPASLTKIFWMVALYSWQENGKISPHPVRFPVSQCETDICEMVRDSDNEAASRIVDLITDTRSVAPKTNYKNWLQKRHSINYFFRKADYSGLNISQKNFPIPYLGMDGPEKWDLRMRGDGDNPIRNKMSAQQAARLFYEIVSNQAVSPDASQEMFSLLKSDLDPKVWKPKQYDSIEGFLGEGIYPYRQSITFLSKVGWTSDSRQEVAYVGAFNKEQYIISVFSEGKEYGDNWEFFPRVSQLVYNRMRQ